ncbi:hypothetical protein B0H11DRAFT_1875039 [Mycena galericulata]|nr:hypothetical protein B0H11DRAFT_1875039 [Mycena galericulata]
MADLKHILTPDLFHFMVDSRIPFPKNAPLDFAEVSRDFNSAGDFKGRIQEGVWPILKALSKVGLEKMPDMMDFLPPPSDPDFPLQCLGLQLVLDQAPRALCSNGSTDGRYVADHFDRVAQRLADAWLALPAAQRPDSWVRWKKSGEGATLDYWILLRIWIAAPLVHCPTVASQERAVAFHEETRAVVEHATGQRDPYRAEREETLSDVYGFPRMIKQGPPADGRVTAATWSWWMLKLMDVHKPIIDRYGRYPYQNAIRGLDSTEEERAWIEKTEHFAEAPEHVARKVKEDVVEGRWTPLGGS